MKESAEYRGDNNSLTYKQKFDFDRFGNLYRKAANNPTTGQQNPLPFTAIEEADISKSTNRFTTGTTYDDAFAYDGLNRNPKRAKYSEVTAIDALGRTTNNVTLQDNTTVSTHFKQSA